MANAGAASLTELGPAGTSLSGSTGYKGGGLNQPTGIALDATGNAWVSNLGAPGLSEFSSVGTPLSNAKGFQAGGLTLAPAVAIDASGNVWLTNESNGPGISGTSVTEFIGLATPVLTPMSACLKRRTGSEICVP